jgi:hypothetical protein
VDVAAVVAAVADFRQIVRPELQGRVIEAFGHALKAVFLLALAAAIAGFVISAAMEWRRLPPKEGDSGSEAT